MTATRFLERWASSRIRKAIWSSLSRRSVMSSATPSMATGRPSSDADDLRAAQYPANLPIRTDDAELLAEPGGLALRRLFEGTAECGAIVRVYEAQNFIGLAAKVIVPAAEDAVHAFRPDDFVGRQVSVPRAEAGDVQCQRQAFMRFSYSFLMALRGFATFRELLAGVVQGLADRIRLLHRICRDRWQALAASQHGCGLGDFLDGPRHHPPEDGCKKKGEGQQASSAQNNVEQGLPVRGPHDRHRNPCSDRPPGHVRRRVRT